MLESASFCGNRNRLGSCIVNSMSLPCLTGYSPASAGASDTQADCAGPGLHGLAVLV